MLNLVDMSLCSGAGIHCYVGSGTTAQTATVQDCNSLGLNREELYCRNITGPDGTVNRNCVVMNWLVGRKGKAIIHSWIRQRR